MTDYYNKYLKYKHKYHLMKGGNNLNLIISLGKYYDCNSFINFIKNNNIPINDIDFKKLKIFKNFCFYSNYYNSEYTNFNIYCNECKYLNLIKKYINPNFSIENDIVPKPSEIILETIPIYNNNNSNKIDQDFLFSFNEFLYYIPDKHFYNKFISQLLLPYSIKLIGKYSFYGNNLIFLNFNNTNVQHIEDFAFANNNIQSINFNNLKIIGSYSFYKNNIKNLKIPISVIEIGENAFLDNKINELEIPSKFKNEIIKIFGLNIENIKYID